MKREHLQHLIRATSSIAGVTDLVVIGSQAILGSYPEWELPPEATMSVEADIAVDHQLARIDVAAETELADRIDGAIGEGSLFQQTHGYYAHGVEVASATRSSRGPHGPGHRVNASGRPGRGQGSSYSSPVLEAVA